jgi:hypothetical protein
MSLPEASVDTLPRVTAQQQLSRQQPTLLND